MEKRYLTILELSKYIGYSKRTIYNWVSHRAIPVIKKPIKEHSGIKKSSSIRFDIVEIDKWMVKDGVKVIKI
ncbi:helix-turn-helix domain-containing protein [bacterium]|nr:helix-turn-helix domain-containing protein [bacterium]